jgi:hypothetical protein
MKNYYTNIVKFSNGKELIIEYGNDQTYFTVKDTTKPTMWVEGNGYKFNTEMVYRKSVKYVCID